MQFIKSSNVRSLLAPTSFAVAIAASALACSAPGASTEDATNAGSDPASAETQSATQTTSGSSSGSGSGSASNGGAGSNGDVSDDGDVRRATAKRLGAPERFLIGLGNDVTAAEGWDPNRAHAYELGTKLDLHYLYLSGLDWPSWNAPEGSYINVHAEAAKARGVVPMFSLYQAAALGENNLPAFATDDFMTKYWRGVRIMYTRLGAFDAPAVVHLEPDLWGYFQKKGDAPSAVRVKVGSIVPECKDLPEDASGFGKCLVRLGHQLAPKALVGFSASTFAAYSNGKSDPGRVAKYLNDVGAGDSDILIVETLDRDAGCFERAIDPLCQRAGSFYWNDADFRAHLAWAKTIHAQTGKALLWWQMPLGVPSASSGSASHYRDNRVEWLFAHPEEFAAAGGVGAVFGTGAPNQTTVKTDGGQFRRAIAGYAESPIAF